MPAGKIIRIFTPRMSVKRITVLLADDHTIVREGLCAMLQLEDDMEVVGEASNGHQAVALASKLVPDVVVMDLAMPLLNGLEAIQRIRECTPASTKVLVLSSYDEDAYVQHARALGASGYLVKDSVPQELNLAIEALARGEIYLSSRVSRHLVTALAADPGERAESSLESLTPRQREVLQLIAEGRSTKEIASVLDVSIKTVETHRAALMARLGIFDVAGLVVYAARNHLISLDGDPD